MQSFGMMSFEQMLNVKFFMANKNQQNFKKNPEKINKIFRVLNHSKYQSIYQQALDGSTRC